MRLLARSAAAVLAVLLITASAAAEPLTIGDFFYDTDSMFGPAFGVANLSDTTLGDGGGTFTDLTLDLLAGEDLLYSTDLGPLTAGRSLETFEDLSVFAFDSARLAVTFSLPGAVGVAPLTSIVFEGSFPSFTGTGHLDSFIQFTPQQSVPEPGTVWQTVVGFGTVLRFRRRRR